VLHPLSVQFGRVAVIPVIIISLLTACGTNGGAQDPEATATATPTARQLLQVASDRLADTQTVRFSLKVEGDTFVDKGESIRLIEADGELQRPDRVRTTFKAKVLVPTVTIQLITVGDQSWTTNLITGDWEEAPEEFTYSPAVLFDNQKGIGPVMGRVTEAKLLGDENVGDRATFHILAIADQDIIGPLSSNTMIGSPIAVNLWIDKETGDLLQARLAEPDTVEKDEPAIWTLSLFDHGAKVAIEPPV